MPDILRMLSQAEQLDFSQNFLIPRPNYIGDTIFPDRKTRTSKLSTCVLRPVLSFPLWPWFTVSTLRRTSVLAPRWSA